MRKFTLPLWNNVIRVTFEPSLNEEDSDKRLVRIMRQPQLFPGRTRRQSPVMPTPSVCSGPRHSRPEF